MYCAYASSLQEFEKVLQQKQVELELLEAKLAQKSVAVAQERETIWLNDITITRVFDLLQVPDFLSIRIGVESKTVYDKMIRSTSKSIVPFPIDPPSDIPI